VKIAILDADPRVCGPMSWAWHLSMGFILDETDDHQVVTISSTKSGRTRSSWGAEKWGTHWSVHKPNVVVKDEDLGKSLDDFDLVILPEPKVPALDKAALKAEGEPLYVTALKQTKTPFIFALHGNDYDSRSAPFLGVLMSLDNWCGTVITHSQRSVESNPIFATFGGPVIELPLPYLPSRSPLQPREYTNTVGTTGRFIFNKGPHLVALAASQLVQTDTTVELWGSAAAGLGASATFVTYESLLPLAEKYARYGDQEEKRGQPGWTEHGNIIRPFRWDVRLKAGPIVRYLGSYTDALAVAERLSVHVNLTGLKFSGGLVEFSTLEAMDAGAICITTPQTSKPEVFDTFEFDLENPPGTPTSAAKQPRLTWNLAQRISEVLEFATEDPENRDELVRHNRDALRDYNNPTSVARTFLFGAFDQ
jgi:glycosyltransferase involved in cell wall biosynthesis